MNRIIRWYNQNRKTIWIVMLTFIAVIALIQTLNNFYKNKTKDETSSSTNVSATTSNKDNYSVVTRQEINESTSNNSENLIKKFFDYCNSGDIENAYNLLSSDCKEELYPTIDDFKQNYYNVIFTEKKSYESLLWINTANKNTYRVQIMADLLSTGEQEYMPIEDYYTVIYENGGYSLSINNYISKQDINASKTQNGITINVKSKEIYKEYELYEIEVKNNTKGKIIFNKKENTKSMYLQDENGLNYIAFLNEIPDSELEISSGFAKELKIKFNRGYKPTIDITKIVFEDINVMKDNEIENIEIDI